MEVDRLSSEEIVNMFEESFQDQVATLNNILSFSVDCEDRSFGQPFKIKVEINGLAGTPTMDDFKQGRIEDAAKVNIERDDIGVATFKLDPSLTTYLSGNDYLIYYFQS